MGDAAFDAWVERARAVALDEAAESVGARLKRAGGGEHAGPCPRCGGDDRFSFNVKKGVWNCRGAEGGNDGISLVMHALECDFIAACEHLTGERPPRGEGRTADPAVARERREEWRDREIGAADAEQKRVARQATALERLWTEAGPIADTAAWHYLLRRRITPAPHQVENLRFVPRLEYRGFADADATEPVPLGSYPAMIAALRDVAGNLVGLHRTYIDPDEPRKLRPPGDASRNAAKKAVGRAGGAGIWLGPPCPVVAIAEGIETALAWYSLGIGPEDVTMCAAYSLGNISGGATGTRRHPKMVGRTIQNGEPDPQRPGLILPDWVREVILLGDGDSDGPTTVAHLLTAARRWRAAGLTVSVSMAPAGKDWNDVLLEQGRAAA